MTDPHLIDRLAARALPGAVEERADGWLLRAGPGDGTRRTNSALPLEATPDPAVAEAWYRERGLSPLLMLTPDQDHAGLDADLAARGWTREAPVDLLVGDPDETLDRLSGPAHRVVPAELVGPPAALRSPDPVVCLGAAGGAGRATAILQDGWTLILALEVAPHARRQGIASALVRAWARLAEGRGLYLQVERENTAAHALYARAGFTRSHGYHYRRAPSP